MNNTGKPLESFKQNLLRYGSDIDTWPVELQDNARKLLGTSQGADAYNDHIELDKLLNRTAQTLFRDTARVTEDDHSSRFLDKLIAAPDSAGPANPEHHGFWQKLLQRVQILVDEELIQLTPGKALLPAGGMALAIICGVAYGAFQTEVQEIDLSQALIQEIVSIQESSL